MKVIDEHVLCPCS